MYRNYEPAHGWSNNLCRTSPSEARVRITELDSVQVALQMTVFEHTVLSKIQEREFVNYVLLRKLISHVS